jgi:hypothetical protein
MAQLITLAVLLMLGVYPVRAAGLFERFMHSDGAITVAVGSDSVDPYFVNKALIVAYEAGVDVNDITLAWLSWLLPRQRPDGGFDRFCGSSGNWRACDRADADDSSMASFLHLVALYDRSPYRRASSAPASALEGMGHAQAKAALLLNRLKTARGTYRAFADEPIEFLMDNTEVYAGLVATGRAAQAAQLKLAIYKYFRTNAQWQPANAPYKQFDFYPSALAPTYLWHTGMVTDTVIDQEFKPWAKQWGREWLTQKHDAYAWGLVAWGARKTSEQHWIRCWRHRHAEHDRTAGWTVIDEAVDLGLAHLGVEPVAQSCAAVLDSK